MKAREHSKERMYNMKIENKNINEIIPYSKNPRKNDKAVKAVENSIREFGFKVPIVVDKNNIIVAGHTRYKAAISLKLEQVPCIVADDLTEQQVKAFRLVDNKTSELAEWDIELLNAEIEDLLEDFELGDDFKLEDFGFNLENILQEDIEALDLDQTEEVEVKKTKGCCCPKCGFEFEVR